MRLDEPYGQELLDGQFKTQKNSVTHLNVVREWQLIVGNMDGSVSASSPNYTCIDVVPFTAGHIRPAICARVYSTVDLRWACQFLYV